MRERVPEGVCEVCYAEISFVNHRITSMNVFPRSDARNTYRMCIPCYKAAKRRRPHYETVGQLREREPEVGKRWAINRLKGVVPPDAKPWPETTRLTREPARG